MPRKARVLVPNCPHHIVQRGHNRKAVFLADQDYQYYLENLKEWKKELGIKLYAWCLMTNHIHIIAEPTDDAMSLSTLMKRVNGRQSAYVNKLEGRSGSLWEGRYKASPIQKDEYLLACIRYVELNPMKAGIVTVLNDYPWSSYRERIGLKDRDILDLDSGYQSLGHTEKDRRHHYRQYLSDTSNSKETALISESLQRNQLTGNHRFIDEIEIRIGLRVENRGRGRPRQGEQ